MSDPEGSLASPLEVLECRGDLAAQVKAVVTAGADYDVDAYVLGIPFNMDGTEGPQAKITRAFGVQLAIATGRRIYEWDERLSSHGADVYLADRDLTRKKKKARRDALAAQIILQAFLDAQANA